MRRILGRLNDSRGQVLIVFILMFTVITIVGLLVVDVGLWYSERRADQTDADLPALAGARECMLQMVTGDYGAYDPAPVVDRVWRDNVAGHGSNPDFTYTSTPCFDPTNGGACGADSALCCVDVVAKHKSENMFSALPLAGHIFDDVAQNIGAKARACAGEAVSAGDTVPAYVASGGDCFLNGDPEQPDFSNYCWVAGGAHDPLRPERQTLDLDKTGEVCSPGVGNKQDVEEMFRNQGMGGNCSINFDDPPTCGPIPWMDCVDVYTGNPFHSQDAVYDRITPPPCDTDGNGIDDLSEVIDPTTHDPVVCSPNAPEGQRYSPRLIAVPLIDSPGEGTCRYGPPCPILGIANFYIAGCVDDRDDLESVLNGSRALTGPDDNPKNETQCTTKIPDGHDAVLGQWVNITTAGGGVGPADPSTTQFGIALCDWEPGGNCAGGSGGTPVPTVAPTSPPPPTVAPTTPPVPTSTPVPPTVAPTSPPPTPQCPPQCILPNGKCKSNCP